MWVKALLVSTVHFLWQLALCFGFIHLTFINSIAELLQKVAKAAERAEDMLSPIFIVKVMIEPFLNKSFSHLPYYNLSMY